MRIIASAPGKMVLAGEYAVLAGAPALALAVKPRAQVEIQTLDGPPSRLVSSLFPGLTIDFNITPTGIETIGNPTLARRLPLVSAILAQIHARFMKAGLKIPSIRMTLDTREFYREENQAGVKLGLGSSAALLVALSAACHRLLQGLQGTSGRELTWPGVWTLHQSLPHQRGSGIDVASSYHGQAILFQKSQADPYPSVHFLELPARLHLRIIWTRRSTDTGSMLQQLTTWQQSDPEHAHVIMSQLGDAASRSAALASQDHAGSWLEAFRLYADALRTLSIASGVDIISREHQEISDVAKQVGLVYKPSGAGGGDIGFAATDDAALMGPFQHQIEAMGYHGMMAPVDSSGLQVLCHSE